MLTLIINPKSINPKSRADVPTIMSFFVGMVEFCAAYERRVAKTMGGLNK